MGYSLLEPRAPSPCTPRCHRSTGSRVEDGGCTEVYPGWYTVVGGGTPCCIPGRRALLYTREEGPAVYPLWCWMRELYRFGAECGSYTRVVGRVAHTRVVGRVAHTRVGQYRGAHTRVGQYRGAHTRVVYGGGTYPGSVWKWHIPG